MSELMSGLKWQLALLKLRRDTITDRICMAIVWRLPRRLALWAFVRVVAHATTGPYADTVVPELTAMEAMGRWESTK